MLRFHIATHHDPTPSLIEYRGPVEQWPDTEETRLHDRSGNSELAESPHEHRHQQGHDHSHRHERHRHPQLDHGPNPHAYAERNRLGGEGHDEPETPPPAAEQPHHHAHLVHTHGVPPEGDAAPLGFALTQFYLPAVVAALTAPSSCLDEAWSAAEKTQSPPIAITTPPPQQLS